LNAFLDYWLEAAAKPKLAIRAYEDYEYRLALYVRPILSLKKLSALQSREIQALYLKMLNGGLSSRSVRAVHTILSSALKQAVKWGMLAVNPAAACELPRKARNEMRAMDAEEAARFIEASRDSIWGLVFRFAIEI